MLGFCHNSLENILSIHKIIINNKLGGHYKVCVESNDKELFKDDKIRFSLILDTDQDDLDGN